MSLVHLTSPYTKVETQHQGASVSSQHIVIPKKKQATKSVKPEIFKKMKLDPKEIEGEIEKEKSKEKTIHHH
jgi:hypothetical protein